jgi:cell division protein FtsQ
MATQISRRQQYQARASKSSHQWRSLIIFSYYVFFASALIVGASFGWRWVQKPTSFPIKKINVEGRLLHESPIAIQHIMQTQLTGGFFSLNISAAKQAILAFPWVADVSFRRVWPHTLNVKITEQEAIARFGKKGVLNAEGAVFYPDIKSLPQNLPDLEGPIDQSQSLFNFYNTANTLAKLIGFTVVGLQVNAEQSWNLTLSNQVKVILGRQDALSRFKRFVAIYPKIAALSTVPMISVDLRYPNGVAIQYQENPKAGSAKTSVKN